MDYFQTAKTYIITNKEKLTIGATAVLGIVISIILVVLLVNASSLRIVYQPVKACNLLTPSKAEDLLGNKVIGVDSNAPVISGDTATSKCSYTDTNPDQASMLIAAVAVRSAINDKGVRQNKKDFAAQQSAGGTEMVKDLGDSAYFNKSLGQLNVLAGREWLILNYGVGASPQTNTLDKAVELAHKVLQ